MSQILCFAEAIVIHHRGAKPSWRIKQEVHYERKSLHDGCCRLQRPKKQLWSRARSYQSAASDVACFSAVSGRAVLFVTSDRTDASRGSSDRCEIHPRTAWSQGKCLRFNVGWQWVDIFLTVTKSWNGFLSKVRECKAWWVSLWVIKLTPYIPAYSTLNMTLFNLAGGSYFDMNNGIWTVDKSSLCFLICSCSHADDMVWLPWMSQRGVR